MLSLCFVLGLLSAAIHAHPSIHDSHHERRQSPSPCENLATEQTVYLLRFPLSTTAVVPANLTYACLTSVPFQKNFSTQLVNNVRAWFEFQSDIDYIASPPSGSLWKPRNLFAFLEDIADDVLQDKYKSQYDFELDLFTFSNHFHDGHTLIAPGLFWTAGAMTFDRNLTLVSYSPDGIEIPKVYLSEDILLETNTGFELVTRDTKASPVATINDIPVQEFLQTQALVGLSHDPDTMYNELLASISLTLNPSPKLNYFKTSFFYPGSETIVKREDGTVLSRPTLSRLACDLRDQQITSGYDFWQTCVFEPEEAAGASAIASATEASATSTATVTDNKYGRAEPTAAIDPAGSSAVLQLPGHPAPERLGMDNLLSGYFLDGHEDVAVLVIRSFLSRSPGFLEDFQWILESFLELAQEQKKTKLIIDFQGNGGGFVDASTELLAQLFPNVPPDQKNNMRASLGMQLILEKESRAYEKILQSGVDAEDVSILEATQIWAAWQALMKPNASEFVSFDDFYGPNDQGQDGNYTRFFQSNYTNSDPTDLDQEDIQITGYGNRLRAPGTPPPFNASDIVILTDGACASACTIAIEMLVNAHSVPVIVVGGRPSVGPMQAIGSTKGSAAWDKNVLKNWFLTWWEDQEFGPIDTTQVASTPFQYLEEFGLTHGSIRLNGRNNYRIGDDTETPLQMVYSAADCRIWPTLEMLTNQSHVWSRVADIAFNNSRTAPGAEGGPYISEFCVEGSTGHSTSVTGGLKHGELGNQNPPRNAYPQYSGWLKDGKEIVQGLSLVRIDNDDSGKEAVSGVSLPSNGQVKVGMSDMKTACDGYSGDKWLITLLCNVLG